MGCILAKARPKWDAAAHSVSITFSYDVPSVQDIDPYVFLAKLTESMGNKSFSQ